MMPAYNADKFVGRAIESVLAQSYAYWELVIVDDGSTDRTVDIAENYPDPRIKIIHQTNAGEAAARNTALAHLTGEFVAFLDADDVYLPEHLEVSVCHLIDHDQVDGVYTDGFYIDQDGRRIQSLSSRRRGPFQGDVFEEVVYSSDVFGPPICVVLRATSIFEKDLKFDENIIIGPDWDFFVHFADSTVFDYIDQPTCLYRVHTSNVSILVDLEKRALEISKCRMNAIQIKSFDKCSIKVRTAVFYDLLVNLLIDFPERQSEVIQKSQFTNLPYKEQTRLLRLMASKTMIHGNDHTFVQYWLDKAWQLNPTDWRVMLLRLFFYIHPKLLRMLLQIKGGREIDPRTVPPFADMNIDGKS